MEILYLYLENIIMCGICQLEYFMIFFSNKIILITAVPKKFYMHMQAQNKNTFSNNIYPKHPATLVFIHGSSRSHLYALI